MTQIVNPSMMRESASDQQAEANRQAYAAPMIPGRPRTLFEWYVDRFGPYAFGVASLILIWYVIVRPELAANRSSTADFQKAAEAFNQATIRLESIAAKLEAKAH